MKKRGKLLLDNIDLKILEAIKKRNCGIMQLRKRLDIHHKNLKPHLDKLHKGKLIQKTPILKSKKIILSLPKSKKINIIVKTLKNLDR